MSQMRSHHSVKVLSVVLAVLMILGLPQNAMATRTDTATPPFTISTSDNGVTDWARVTTSVTDPIGDINGSGEYELTKLWMANDADYLYVRWDLKLPSNLSTIGNAAYGIYFDSDRNGEVDHIGWVGFAQGAVEVTIEVVGGATSVLPAANGQQVGGGSKGAAISVEGKFPLADLGTSADGTIYWLWAEAHPSASYTSNVKDRIPDGGAMQVNLTDGSWGTVSATPTARADSYTTDEDTTLTTTALDGVLANDSDFDNPVMTAGSATQPAHGSVTLRSDGSFTYTPDANYSGTDTFTYRATGGTQTTTATTVTITVAAVNDNPVAADDSFSLSSAAGATTLNVLGNDADPDTGDSLTIISVDPAAHGSVSIAADSKSLRYTPDPGYSGTVTFSYTVEDTSSATATANVTVTLAAANRAPTAAADTVTLTEDAAATAVDVLANDSDPDGDSLTITAITQGAHGAVVITGAGTGLTYKPAANYAGSDSFTYTASDGRGGADTASVSVTVADVNDKPTVSAIANQTVDQDTPTAALPFTVGDVETAPGSLTVTAGSSNQTLVPDENIVISGTGASRTVKVTPAPGQTGTVTITISVFDGTDTVTETFTVTFDPVSAVNEPPTISNIADQTVDEDHATAVLPFTVGDAETAAAGLTVTATSSNQGLVPDGNITLGGSGANRTVKVTPAADQSGTVTITVTVSDGTDSTSDNFVVTVLPINDLPTISAIPDQTISRNSATGTLTFTVDDVETPAGSLVVTATSSNQTLVPDGNIELVDLGGGNWTVKVTPAAGQTGTATITLSVFDGTATVTTTFDVTVQMTVSPPTISDIPNQTVDEDHATGVLSFTVGDAETAAASLTVTAASSNQGLVPDGSITLGGSGASRTVKVTPAADQSGLVTITVTVNDGGETASDTFVVTVNPVNDLPSISAIPDQTINRNMASGTLALTVDDVETPAGSLVVTASSSNLTLVPNGNIELVDLGNGNWSVKVTPAAGQTGTATITLSVFDGTATVTTTFDVTVQMTVSPPTISDIPNQTVDEDHATGVLAFMVGDAETAAAALTVMATSSNKTLVPDANIDLGGSGASRTVKVTPAADQSGLVTITVTVNDGGETASDTFVVTVNPVNDLPAISAVADQTISRNTATGSLAFTVDDVETPAGSLVVTATSSNQTLVPDGNIELVDLGNGSWTVKVTPAAGQTGTATITLSVFDGTATVTTTFDVTVQMTASPPTISDIPNQTVDEDHATGVLSFTVGDAETAAADLTVTAASSNQGLVPDGNITLGGSGANRTFKVTPAANKSGATTITVTVNDGGETASDTFVVTVTPVNDLPTISAITDQTINRNTATGSLAFTVDDVETTAGSLVVTASSTNQTLVPNGNIELVDLGNGNWTVKVTPAAGQTGTATITLSVFDGTASVTTTFDVTVQMTVSPPTISDIPNQTVDEDHATGVLSFTVGDAETAAASLTVTATSSNQGLVPDGSITLGGSGANRTVKVTPAADQSGTVTITVTVNDGGETASDTFVVTVNPVNDDPVLNAIGNKSTDEGAPISFVVSASDSDLPGQTLTYTATGLPSGATFDPETRTFTWTPGEADNGPHQITIQVSDGTAADSESITVTVNEVNEAPVLAAIGNKSATEGTQLSFTVSATDSDLPAQTLTYSMVSGPVGANFSPATRTFTWTPGEAQAGDSTVIIRVGDGAATDEESITITVSETNSTPSFGAVGAQTVDEGAELNFTVSATDSDLPAQPLTYSMVSGPDGATFDPDTRTFAWTPGEAQDGNHSATFQATDGQATAEVTVAIIVNEVNADPVLAAIGNKAATEGAQMSFAVSATDSDLPVQTLTYSMVSGPAGATFNPVTRTFAWTPGEAQDGANTVTIRVSDGQTKDEESITVTVSETNITPAFSTIDAKTADEGAELSFTVSATDSDLPAQPLTYSMVSGPDGATFDPDTRTFAWTPGEAQDGNHSATFQATDGQATAEVTVAITVNEVNADPVLAAIGNKAVDEGSELRFVISATDSDLPAQALTFSVLTGPVAATYDPVTRTFAWTPGEADNGPHQVTIQVSDGTAADTETITVTVNEVNEDPVLAAIGDKAATEGAQLSFTVSATDNDLPAQTLTYSMVSGPMGADFDPATRTFTWTPGEAQDGAHTVTIRVSDGLASDDESITVTVGETNSIPAFIAVGAKSVNEGAELSFTVSATDSDLPAQTLTYSMESGPAGAAFDPDTRTFTWTPGEAQDGNHSATFQATDGQATVEVTVAITVSEVNETPELVLIADQNVNERAALTFTVSATDADRVGGLPNILSYSLVDAPDGAFLHTATGEFAWTAPEGTTDQTFTATVRVTDSGTPAAYHEQVFTITVHEINRLPAFTGSGTQSIHEGETPALLTATDADGDTLKFRLTGGTLPPGITLNEDGSFGGRATYASAGIYTVTIEISDGRGGVRTITLTLTILNVDTRPELEPIDDQVDAEHSQLSVAAIGSDLDGDRLTYAAQGLPSGLSINASTGVISGTLSYSSSGTHSVTVTVTDNTPGGPDGDSASRTFQWRVSDVNRGPSFTTDSANTAQAISEGEGLAALNATDPDRDGLTYSRVSGSLPAGITVKADGTFSGTANAGTAGTYTVTFQVSDGGASDRTTLTITVNPISNGIFGVVYSATGGTVAGMPVYLLQGAQQLRMVATDESGGYRFTTVLPGTYTVAALNAAQPLASRSVTITAADREVRADLTLPARGTLTLVADPASLVGDGRSTSTLKASLTFTNGMAVPGVSLRFATTAGHLSATSGTTDAAGRASAVLTAPTIEGTQSVTETAEVIVRDAEHGLYAEARIRITFTPAAIIGVVIDSATGQPVNGALVEVAEDFDGDGVIDFAATATTGPDGRYQITVPRGNWSYHVKITATVQRNGRPVTLVSSHDAQVGQLQGTGERIPAERTIGGQLLIVGNQADGPEQAGSVLQSGTSVSGTIRSADRKPVNATVAINNDGTFSVEGLEPGQYEILFQLTAPDGQRLAGTMIRVTVSQDGELALNTGLIDPYGIVKDAVTGLPVAGVKMTLFWADTPLNQAKGRTPHSPVSLPLLVGFAPNQNAVPQNTTADGAYAWMVYPEGDYYVVAEREGYHTYDSRAEGRTTAPAPGEDSYVTRGIIHVGETIVQYNLTLKPGTQPAPPAVPGGTPVTPTTPVIPTTPVTPPGTVPGAIPVTTPEAHLRYVLGYPDGRFGPENSITRAEVATVLARIVRGKLVIEPGATPFSDVDSKHWASGYIAAVMQDGLMIGDPDGRFRPDQPISRAEVATIAVRFKGLRSQTENAFSDVTGHWAEQFINTAHRARLVTGYPDGTFLPQKQTSRAEFVTIINRMLGRGPLLGRTAPTWPDVPAVHWAWGQVEEASTNHEYERLQDQTERWIRDH